MLYNKTTEDTEENSVLDPQCWSNLGRFDPDMISERNLKSGLRIHYCQKQGETYE